MLFDGSTDRVLVRGASGWLGRELIAILLDNSVPFLPIGSANKTINFGPKVVEIFEDDFNRSADFQPNWLFDFAHLTKDKETSFSVSDFLNMNLRINQVGLEYLKLASLNYAVFTSSGAAVTSEANPYFGSPYAESKRHMEELVWSSAKEFRGEVAVMRPWSITGIHVQRPLDYAFSNLALQANSGKILINSPQRVFRRFTAVQDLLSVMVLKLRKTGGGFTLDSGGEKVSLDHLAKIMAEEFSAEFIEPNYQEGSNSYFSSNESWLDSCRVLSFTPVGVTQQVKQVTNAIRIGLID